MLVHQLPSHNYDGLWHASDFTITLSAVDSESGVADTYYRIDQGEEQLLSTNGQPRITLDGATNKLEFWSVDNTGNIESVQVMSGIKLDKSNPIIGNTVTPPENEVKADQDVTVSVDVSDSISGVESVMLSYSVDDGSTWENLPMNLNSTTELWQATIPSQSIWTSVNYKILSYDNAGNSASSNATDFYYDYEVIPEFSSEIFLLLFTVVTLCAIVVGKKLRWN